MGEYFYRVGKQKPQNEWYNKDKQKFVKNSCETIRKKVIIFPYPQKWPKTNSSEKKKKFKTINKEKHKGKDVQPQ